MADMRRIEIVEEVCHLHDGQVYHKGDVHSFPTEWSDEYIRLGWAKDHETGETGTREPGAQALHIDNVVQDV